MILAVALAGTQAWGADGWAYREGLPYRLDAAVGLANFLYSPAFAVAFAPFDALPDRVFVVVWSLIALLSYTWLLWPAPLRYRPLLIGLAILPVWIGNIEWLLALACVAALRCPAVWAIPLLTKVTTGVGVLWHAFRREWWALGSAAAGVVLVALVAATLVGVESWGTWIATLGRNASEQSGGYIWPRWLPQVPLAARLAIALGLLAWAAPRDRRWALPVAVMLGQPDWHPWTLGILAAIPRLRAGPGHAGHADLGIEPSGTALLVAPAMEQVEVALPPQGRRVEDLDGVEA